MSIQTRCNYCHGPVPEELWPENNDLPPDHLTWCTGQCANRDFAAAIYQVMQRSVSAEKLQAVLQELQADPPPLAPADLGDLATPAHIRDAIRVASTAALQGRLDHKQTSLILYALQTALATLRTSDKRAPKKRKKAHK